MKKRILITILLVFSIILCSSVAFAEDTSDFAAANDELGLQENSDISDIIQSTEDSKLSSTYDIKANSDSDTIQNTINNMSDGDTLNFEEGTYNDICIYVDKSITINGNGAQLIGYEHPNENTTPNKVIAPTPAGGYSATNYATLYVLNTTNVVINGVTVVGQDPAYGQAAIFANSANNLTIEKTTVKGGYWGIYLEYCADGTIKDNTIQNQEAIGIINFGSARTLIANNKVINAKNHGIDARHGTGPNVQIIDNTVIGAKEGIYLMHSKGHTAAGNTLINCTTSSITCYGSGQITLSNNTLQKSRIGILLGGGYYDINIEENTFKLDNLPFPPTFVYYVAQANSAYQTATDVIGTYSDSSSNAVPYTSAADIATPVAIKPDYTAILNPTGTTYNVTSGMTGKEIQSIIDSMADGDTLSFEENAVFNDISIYADKNIKIIGNNATLIGFDNINAANVPAKIRNSTADGGYAIGEYAVLYIVNTTGAVVSDLNIVAQYPGYDTTKATTNTEEYKTVGLHLEQSKKISAVNLDISGASWGIFLRSSPNGLVANNNIHDLYTTGIMNFGSANTTIMSNKITNAFNHGIDVRHGTGPNVVIYNNTVSGAKEGIYLMHSKGHTVYENSISNYKISAITAYGSGNEAIFNNTISAGRLYFLLGGGYYNVTIGENKYPPAAMYYPFPPTFREFIAQADSKFQDSEAVIGLYDTNTETKLVAEDINLTSAEGTVDVKLTNGAGNAISNEEVILTLNDVNYTAKTDANGIATFEITANEGENTAVFTYNAKLNYANSTATSKINVVFNETVITAAKVTKTYNVAKNLVATLNDTNGNKLANKTVTLSINGKTYNSTTDDNGKATFALTNLAPKSYTATVAFAGGDNYKASSTKVSVVVKKATPKLTAKAKTFKVKTKTKKYIITLKTNKGKVLKNTKVTLKVKGKTYSAKTNSKGKATFKITKLTKTGKFTATVKTAKTTYYNTVTKKVKITVKK
ncbi:right-handed parallel beta-helix repeat-containing protein [Methanobrevibacter sp.]|uniref:right-handed parallel beta-helix repeat-containing protein n=1 Tax=Methanobrevibacter sp. TaxID=66852 RepID=UPI0038636659